LGALSIFTIRAARTGAAGSRGSPVSGSALASTAGAGPVDGVGGWVVELAASFLPPPPQAAPRRESATAATAARRQRIEVEVIAGAGYPA